MDRDITYDHTSRLANQWECALTRCIRFISGQRHIEGVCDTHTHTHIYTRARNSWRALRIDAMAKLMKDINDEYVL